MSGQENLWLWLAVGLGMVVIVWLLRQIQRAWRQLHQPKQSPMSEHVRTSLYVLGKSILDDQIELSEACIRIKVLLDNAQPGWHGEPDLAIFSRMYDDMSHMPTHQARQDTDKRFIHKLDQQRFRLEHENRDDIRAAAQALLMRIDVV